jgi:hypothetical protein
VVKVDKALTRGVLVKTIIKEFAAPLAIATGLLVVLLYGSLSL